MYAPNSSQILVRRRLLAAAAFGATALASSAGRTNGFEAPVDIDKPAPAVAGQSLPFPLVDEPVPVVPVAGAKELPRDAVYLRTPNLLAGAAQKDATGKTRAAYEAVIVRQSRIAGGKVTVPAGGLGYVAEVSPAAPPEGGSRLSIAGSPAFFVDVDQVVVLRKGVTFPLGEPVVIGSNALSYAAYLPIAGTVSASFGSWSAAGYEWGRMGLGAFEISMTQPAWHSKIFRDGLVQGRIEEISPAFVRLAWVSGTRAEALVVAGEEVRAARVKGGEEIPLEGGKILKIGRVDGIGRRVTLETPDGSKTLAESGDPKKLPEDTESRKKLTAVGKGWAAVLVPGASDFAKGEAFVGVYTKLSTYRRGEAFGDDTAFRVYPLTLPTGHVVGVYAVNDKPIELDAAHASAPGPAGAFKLVTTWSAAGQLESFGVDDKTGGASARVPAKDRTSIDLLAGAGPTLESLLARSSLLPASTPPPAPPPPEAPPPPPPAAPAPTWQSDPVAFARPHLPWVGGGAAAGFLFAWIAGAFRRRKSEQ